MAVEAQKDLKTEKWAFFMCLVKGGFCFKCHRVTGQCLAEPVSEQVGVQLPFRLYRGLC